MSTDPTQNQDPLTRNLRELKDKRSFLHHKIQAIELKHESAQKWITENQKNIVETYASLHNAADSAIEKKDMSLFIEALVKASPLDGISLDIPRIDGKSFYDYIAENGKDLHDYDHALKIMEQIPRGIPASAFKKIDEQTDNDIANDQESHKAEAKKTASWWKRLASVDVDESLAELNAVKSDLLEIQKKRPYKKAVINGFFEWATEATEQPNGAEASENIDHLKDQHEDPEYVANIAQHDFNETLRAFISSNMEIAQQYTRFKNFLSNPEAHSEQNLTDIIDSPHFDDICTWAVEGWAPLDGTKTISAALQEQMDHTPQFFGFLNQLLKVESPAHGQPNTFMYNMLDSIFKLENEDRLTTLKIALKAVKKAGAPIAPLLEETGALRRVTESNIERSDKKELLQTLLTEAKPEGYSVPVSKLASVIDVLEPNTTNLKDFSDHHYTDYQMLEPEGYALLSIIKPDLNLYISCLNQDSKDSPSFFSKIMRNAIPFDMGKKTDYTAFNAFEDVCQKILDGQIKWAKVLPDLYTWVDHYADKETSVSDQIITSLLKPANNGPERFIDYIMMQNDSLLMDEVLSFLPTPIAQVNFLYDMAENAPTPALQERYLEISQNLDTPLLEYQKEQAFAPANVSFVVAQNNKITCQLEDTSYTLPGDFKDEEMFEIFYGLLRYGFTEVGGQLVNPANIGYAEVSGTDQDTTLQLYPNSINAKLQITGEDADSALEKLTSANPALLRLADSVVNLNKLDLLYFEDDLVNFVFEDTTVLTLKCEGTAKENIKNILSENQNFISIGDHYINTDNAESFVYFEEDEQFVILNGAATYTAGEQLKRFDEAYLHDVIPAISCPSGEAKNILGQLKKHGYSTEGNVAIQPESVCEISAQPDDENQNLVLMLSKQKRIFDCLTTSEQNSLKDKILAAKEFIQLGDLEIAVDKIKKYDCDSTNPHIIVGNTVHSLEDLGTIAISNLADKLSALKDSRHIDRAQSIIFDAGMLDAIHNWPSDGISKRRLSLVYNGICETSDRDGGTIIVKETRLKQMEDIAANDKQSQKNLHSARKLMSWMPMSPMFPANSRTEKDLHKLTKKPEALLFGDDYEKIKTEAAKQYRQIDKTTTSTSATYYKYGHTYNRSLSDAFAEATKPRSGSYSEELSKNDNHRAAQRKKKRQQARRRRRNGFW